MTGRRAGALGLLHAAAQHKAIEKEFIKANIGGYNHAAQPWPVYAHSRLLALT